MDYVALLMEYLPPELMLIVAVVVVIGLILKRTERVKDKDIPIWLWGAGVFLTILYYGVIDGMGMLIFATYTYGLIYGTLVTGVAILGHQIYKQQTKSE